MGCVDVGTGRRMALLLWTTSISYMLNDILKRMVKMGAAGWDSMAETPLFTMAKAVVDTPKRVLDNTEGIRQDAVEKAAGADMETMRNKAIGKMADSQTQAAKTIRQMPQSPERQMALDKLKGDVNKSQRFSATAQGNDSKLKAFGRGAELGADLTGAAEGVSAVGKAAVKKAIPQVSNAFEWANNARKGNKAMAEAAQVPSWKDSMDAIASFPKNQRTPDAFLDSMDYEGLQRFKKMLETAPEANPFQAKKQEGFSLADEHARKFGNGEVAPTGPYVESGSVQPGGRINPDTKPKSTVQLLDELEARHNKLRADINGDGVVSPQEAQASGVSKEQADAWAKADREALDDVGLDSEELAIADADGMTPKAAADEKRFAETGELEPPADMNSQAKDMVKSRQKDFNPLYSPQVEEGMQEIYKRDPTYHDYAEWQQHVFDRKRLAKEKGIMPDKLDKLPEDASAKDKYQMEQRRNRKAINETVHPSEWDELDTPDVDRPPSDWNTDPRSYKLKDKVRQNKIKMEGYDSNVDQANPGPGAMNKNELLRTLISKGKAGQTNVDTAAMGQVVNKPGVKSEFGHAQPIENIPTPQQKFANREKFHEVNFHNPASAAKKAMLYKEFAAALHGGRMDRAFDVSRAAGLDARPAEIEKAIQLMRDLGVDPVATFFRSKGHNGISFVDRTTGKRQVFKFD